MNRIAKITQYNNKMRFMWVYISIVKHTRAPQSLSAAGHECNKCEKCDGRRLTLIINECI